MFEWPLHIFYHWCWLSCNSMIDSYVIEHRLTKSPWTKSIGGSPNLGLQAWALKISGEPTMKGKKTQPNYFKTNWTSACWLSPKIDGGFCPSASSLLAFLFSLSALFFCPALNILFHFHWPNFRLPPRTPGERPLLLPREAVLHFSL